MSLILGIDPGTRATGWGIIKKNSNSNEWVHHGVIHLKGISLAHRLLQLSSELDKIFQIYQPQEMALEKIFLSKNVDSAFKLGHARGVCMLMAAHNKANVSEYAARKVKQCIVGSGSARKEQVQAIINAELGLKKSISLDASDALAIALCHSYHLNIQGKLKLQQESCSP